MHKLATTCLFILIYGLPACQDTQPTTKMPLKDLSNTRPHILFTISDDQSYPHASAYGYEAIQTPAFDRIAREGILFHNAFTASTGCCPSPGSHTNRPQLL